MGSLWKLAAPLLLVAVSLLLVSSSSYVRSSEEGFITAVISDRGLDFAKNLLIDKAVSTIIPLQLSDIEKTIKIPLIGKVHMVLSDIVIDHVDIPSSRVETGETGIRLIASGSTANLSMKWQYSYRSWVIDISDHGDASVQDSLMRAVRVMHKRSNVYKISAADDYENVYKAVDDMDIGLAVTLNEHDGSLGVSLLDCGCSVKDMYIDLDGGASWLYQGVVDAFQGKIGSAVENAISKKIRGGIRKLDSLAQSLPKEIHIIDFAALNITFVENPVFYNSSVEFKVDGLFTRIDDVSGHYHGESQDGVYCNDPSRMIDFSLHENVLNSASQVVFNTHTTQWIVRKIPDQSLLNTAAWKDVFPQLYNDYPDDDINLNISISSPPFISVMDQYLDATLYSDVIVDVLNAGEVVSIACITLEVTASYTPEILENHLEGHVSLKSFEFSLKWSKLTGIHSNLLQSITSSIIDTVFLPYINFHLEKGVPSPHFHGFSIENAEILCTSSRVNICSDIANTKNLGSLLFNLASRWSL